MPESKAKPVPKPVPRTRTPPKKVKKEVTALAKIAVVGIPASGKTTYFRFLSGHFGLNLPIVYVRDARKVRDCPCTATSRRTWSSRRRPTS